MSRLSIPGDALLGEPTELMDSPLAPSLSVNDQDVGDFTFDVELGKRPTRERSRSFAAPRTPSPNPLSQSEPVGSNARSTNLKLSSSASSAANAEPDEDVLEACWRRLALEEGLTRFDLQKTPFLRIHNNPWLSWIPILAFGLFMILIGLVILVFSNTLSAVWYNSATLCFVGFLICLQAKSERYVFDRKRDKLYVHSVGISGARTTWHWLYEIHEVDLYCLMDTQGGSDYRLTLLMRSGQRIPLIQHHFFGTAKEAKVRACAMIKEFLSNDAGESVKRKERKRARRKSSMKRTRSGEGLSSSTPARPGESEGIELRPLSPPGGENTPKRSFFKSSPFALE